MRVYPIFTKRLDVRFPSMTRSVIYSVKRKKWLTLCHYYGSSSKPASSNLPSKLNLLNLLKNSSENLFPAIWKSAAIVSTLFNNVVSQLTKYDNTHTNLKNSTKCEDSKKDLENSIASPDSDKILQNTKSSNANLVFSNSETDNVKLDVLKRKEGNSELEETFFEWLTGNDFTSKRKEFLERDEKKVEKSKKPIISKSNLRQRSRFLVFSLSDATSSGSQLLRLEEICKHLLLYPEQKTVMCKAGLLRTVLPLKYNAFNTAVQEQAKCVLALVGYHNAPKGNGIRILSIDGGGTRAIMAMEVLRQLEAATNKKVYQLFDFICGVSSGAVLGTLLGGLRMSLDECESLYRKLSDDVFNQSTFWGTSSLMWNHAYYDTTVWVKVLKKIFEEKLLIETAKDENLPKIAAVSAVMNLPQLQAFVFRNYDFAPSIQSYYRGSCHYKMWEAIRASGAAPGYFEEFCLDDYLHQDGGILVNNPTALAIHEAKLLWPTEHIQCVLSLGCGRYCPSTSPNFTSTSLKTKALKVIDSATDTEAVHVSLNDLLSANTYFRINPYLTEFLTLDENRPEKLDQLKGDAQMYLRKNEYKFFNAAQTLCIQRGYAKRAKDWLYSKLDLIY